MSIFFFQFYRNLDAFQFISINKAERFNRMKERPPAQLQRRYTMCMTKQTGEPPCQKRL